MKFRIDRKYIKFGMISFLVLAAAICFYYLVFHGDRFLIKIKDFMAVLSPVVYGIVIAYLMTPMVNYFERRLYTPLFCKLLKKQELSGKHKKYMRAASIFLAVIVVVVLIYGFFSILIPNIIRSIQSISYQFPYYIQNLTAWSAQFLEDNPDIERMVVRVLDSYSGEFTDYLNNNIIPRMETILKQVSLSMISLIKVLWNVMIGFIISIYVLYNKEYFAGQAKKLTYALFNVPTANQLIKDVRFSSDTFIGFLSGKILDSFIIGCICFVGTTLLHTPYALLVSVVVGVTNVIPFFGPYMGAIPSAILILMVNPYQCIYFVIFIFILQQIDGNIIGPKILGGTTGLSGFWVIFSITVFGGLFGVFGMIIGVPFFAVLYAMLGRNADRLLKKRGLPIETGEYLDVDYINADNDAFIRRTVEEKKKSRLSIKKKEEKEKEEEQQ